MVFFLLKIILFLVSALRGYLLLAIVFFALPFASGLAMSLLFTEGIQSQTASFMFIGTFIKCAHIISIAGLVYTAFAPTRKH
jgi:hypothetical protein